MTAIKLIILLSFNNAIHCTIKLKITSIVFTNYNCNRIITDLISRKHEQKVSHQIN